jgi:hypothetical protein
LYFWEKAGELLYIADLRARTKFSINASKLQATARGCHC